MYMYTQIIHNIVCEVQNDVLKNLKGGQTESKEGGGAKAPLEINPDFLYVHIHVQCTYKCALYRMKL